jgi:hypothetical protein
MKVIDSAVCTNWPRLTNAKISNAGRFAAFKLIQNKKITLRVRSLHGSWIREFSDIQDYYFVDGEQLVIQSSTNTLSILKLGTDHIRTIGNLKSMRIVDINALDYLIYLTKGGELVWQMLQSKNIITYSNVITFHFDEISGTLSFVSPAGNQQAIKLVDLASSKLTEIGVFQDVSNLVMNKKGSHLAFLTKAREANAQEVYFISKEGLKVYKIPLIKDQTIDHIIRINNDGSKLFLECREKKTDDKRIQKASVKIWNSGDVFILPHHEKLALPAASLWMVEIGCNRITRITERHEKFRFYEGRDDLIEITKQEGTDSDRSWNEKANPQTFLFNASTNNKLQIPFNVDAFPISPDGKYLAGYDSLFKNIITCDLLSGKIRRFNILSCDDGFAFVDLQRAKIAGWMDDHKLLYYDNYDLFIANLSEDKVVRCVTKGLGRDQNLRLRIAFKPPGSIYSKGDIQILSAFDLITKQNGFYRLDIKSNRLYKTIMSSHLYVDPIGEMPLVSLEKITKAKNCNVWLLTRQSAGSFPNYYTTRNFKDFFALSDLSPEQSHQWYESKLISFEPVHGKRGQAIIYTPLNFDPNKKYPVILHYYEKLSHRLNYYLHPAFTGDLLNVPWFVSRGYIVCTPDIHFTPGETGKSFYNYVVGTFNEISKLPYVDSLHVGLQGHSFGGFGTNFIITQTNKFKAAVSGSGISDFISLMGVIKGDGRNEGEHMAIFGQVRFEKTFQEDQLIYIKNSPLFYAREVSIPVLMMANIGDGVVNVNQSIEFFTALRRYKRKAWLLQYEAGDHGLSLPDDQLDYTRKIEEFFNHYLKDEVMPDWMKVR